MSTLLIELAGPQQAWGSRSRFAMRGTELAPTKSGVIGMVAAALGMERSASLERFEHLRFGVRIDQPGQLERDFQTTRSLDGSQPFPLSHRFYLADAVFLVAIEGSDDEVLAYRDALAHPRYPLFLGRRAFPPDGPLNTWIVAEPLERALEKHPWRARLHHKRRVRTPKVALAIVRDAGPEDVSSESRSDVPVSFDPRRRRYASRDVTVGTVELDHPDASAEPGDPAPPPARRHGDVLLGSPTDHDPESLLADEEV